MIFVRKVSEGRAEIYIIIIIMIVFILWIITPKPRFVGDLARGIHLMGPRFEGKSSIHPTPLTRWPHSEICAAGAPADI